MALTAEDLQAIAGLIAPVHERLDRMDERFDRIEERLDRMDERFDRMDERLDKMDSELAEMNGRLSQVERHLKVMEQRQNLMPKKLDNLLLDTKVTERDIRRELHSLNDKMDTVIEILRQNEMLPR